MIDPRPIVQSLQFQSTACAALGSPFYAGLLARAAEDAGAGGPTLALMRPWAGATAGSLFAYAVPLRLLGALHDLVLSGDAPALAAAYPGGAHAAEPASVWPVVVEAMNACHDRLAAFMMHEPQTNEVRRAAVLLPGFLMVASDTGLGLRCFEIGASAGLNQLWDRFGYRFGAKGTVGDLTSTIVVDTEWRGGAPPLGPMPRVVERAACDTMPVDLRDQASRRRLKSYVWPDQFDRLPRLDGAIALARDMKVVVEQEDAISWTPQRVRLRAGTATVLFHSVMWSYLPMKGKAVLSEIIHELGESAHPEMPFAWLRMESEDAAMYELRLTVWPGGEDRRLAIVHPHGAWIDWHA